MEPMIETVELPELVCIGIEVEGDRQALLRLVPDAWNRLFAAETGAKAFLEVSQPADNGRYRKLVGFLAASQTEIPAGMRQLVLPPAKCLRLSHSDRLTAIPDSFVRLERHAATKGIGLTGLKLDFGYLRGFATSRHELHAVIAPAPLLLG